jgi:tetratricopeptide (TPR) repeat protein
MKTSICIFLFIWLARPNCANAQTQEIDSLKRLLQTENNDSLRCSLLIKLSDEYSESKPDTAFLLVQQGLLLAEKIKFTTGEILCLSRMGLILVSKGNDAKALELLLRSLKKSESIHEQRLGGYILRCIGNVYEDQGDERKSLEYTLKARDIAFAIHDTDQVMACAINIGYLYEELNQLDSSSFFTKEAYNFGVRNNQTPFMGLALNNLGNIYLKMQEPAVAMSDYRMSMFYLLHLNMDDVFCETTLGIAKILQQEGRDDSCVYYAKLSYFTAKKDGFTKYELSSGTFLADYYKKHHVVDSAYGYLSLVIAAKDSIFSQEKTKAIQTLSFDETIRQQDIAAQKKHAEENHIRNLQLLAIGIFIPVFFLGVLFLSRTKVKPRIVEFLGILSLLLFFEFITDLIYPYVSQLTNENPIWEMLFLVILAASLEPLNFRLEHWVKKHLVHRAVPPPIQLTVENTLYDVG